MNEHRIKRFGIGLVAALLLGTTAAPAQGPGPGGGPPPGFTPPPPPETQGFESNVQITANYTAEEAAAARIVEQWIDGTQSKNLDTAMAVIDDNIMVRPDPARQMAYGPVAQCSSYPFTRDNSFVRLDELYAVGGPLDTAVLFKRADINGPAGGRGGFSGFTVQVAAFVRVSNGLITEWLDAPINRIGGLVNAPEGANSTEPAGARVADACRAYPLAERSAPAPSRTDANPTYGTAKPEFYWNVEETQGAQAVRAWFAAWQAGDPLLLGAFVDHDVVFRTQPTDEIVKGRDELLRSVCGSIGGERRLTELYPLGSDFNTLVLTESVTGDGTRIASLFRVQNSLITEWLDVVVERGAAATTANPNAAACQALSAALG